MAKCFGKSSAPSHTHLRSLHSSWVNSFGGALKHAATVKGVSDPPCGCAVFPRLACHPPQYRPRCYNRCNDVLGQASTRVVALAPPQTHVGALGKAPRPSKGALGPIPQCHKFALSRCSKRLFISREPGEGTSCARFAEPGRRANAPNSVATRCGASAKLEHGRRAKPEDG